MIWMIQQISIYILCYLFICILIGSILFLIWKMLCKKKLIERGVYYIADFVYYRDGEYIVEDTKGVRTKDYIIKRKLMLYVHGIKIKEV